MIISRTPFVSSLLVLAALIPLAGCAHTAATGATSTPSASATPASTPAPSASHGTAGCASVPLTITNADNNKTLCVTTGTTISVFLHGTASDKWTPIHSNSIAVTARSDPRMTLQVGVTGASFDAAAPGTATITSTRLASHFHVTLDIRYRGAMGR